ncbi:MAG: TIR domain-containing protein [Treponema sp.]|uniref:TIR domain-containing protein n=1 Tax=Treponema sp. TaxID=166 RepID=UPI0025EF2750|nr:TIR domain-containing protein [Treponema sp.]MBQ8680434.1 TIR domain-containing protein [Treponema sp.]
MNEPRIFISHSWNYDDYEDLEKLLKNRAYFDWQESSVPATEPIEGNRNEVWDTIENKIKWSQVVILIAGVYATYSNSIKREISIAKYYGKPIIAIVPFGQERTSYLTAYATETVGWRADSVVKAIRKYC